MSDDEADPELLELLRQRLGITQQTPGEVSNDTGVLKDAEFIYNNAIDVSIDMFGTKSAAVEVYRAMQRKSYSRKTWSQHELHPKCSEGFGSNDILNFVFTMDLLNFSFWSELSEEERFQVEYRGQRWTGYNSLVACLRRALDEGTPITTPRFWRSRACSDDVLTNVFRSATAERIPLLNERIQILREAGDVLRESFADPDEEDVEDSLGTPDEQGTSLEDNDTTAAMNGNRVSHDLSTELSREGTQFESLRIDSNALAEPLDAEGSAVEAASTAGPAVIDDLQPREATAGQGHLDPVNSDIAEAGIQMPSINERTALETIASSASDITRNTSLDDTSGGPYRIPISSFSSGAQRTGSPNESTALHGSPSHAATDHRPEQRADHAVERLVQQANHSAGKLVNLLAKHFPAFCDEARFDGRRVRILKRAQIFVADLWAALDGAGAGEFEDIDHLTMFADYRVPQCLHSLGVLTYSPPLDYHIRRQKLMASGHSWEVQLRGCSIWAVELLRREIVRMHPERAGSVNAVLIDFFLYDLAKEKEAQAIASIPTHRTRSVWY